MITVLNLFPFLLHDHYYHRDLKLNSGTIDLPIHIFEMLMGDGRIIGRLGERVLYPIPVRHLSDDPDKIIIACRPPGLKTGVVYSWEPIEFYKVGLA